MTPDERINAVEYATSHDVRAAQHAPAAWDVRVLLVMLSATVFVPSAVGILVLVYVLAFGAARP